MSNRSWFYASNGQQQGPYPEAQLRDLIARGTVRADTLVWSEGMAGWEKAGTIPDLMMSGGSAPPAVPRPGGPPMAPNGGYASGSSVLSFDFGIWDFVWRSVVTAIGCVLIIPVPWVLVWYTKWIIPSVRVPGRPNLSFTGGAMTIVPWYFGAVVLAVGASLIGPDWLNNVVALVQFALYWLFLKWLVANLASNGQPLGLSFSGTVWAYIGWSILTVLSVFTIIGWAWVYVAWMRWVCRNIQGTRRAIVFHGTGLEFLWRSLVAAIASLFIIPIPWVYLWMSRWMASQTELVDRATLANA